MELFSLEEDDGNDLFITQESSYDRNNLQNCDKYLGKDATDFQSPCVSVIDKFKLQYSDISDDDFMDIPSSQIPRNDDGDSKQ